jgi:hypothetical protein
MDETVVQFWILESNVTQAFFVGLVISTLCYYWNLLIILSEGVHKGIYH